jgi:hypothetical protein
MEIIMGWLFNAKSKQALIQELVSPQRSDCYTLVISDYELNKEGDVLWTLTDWTYTNQCGVVEKATFISCYLLDCSSGQWGYKSLDEQTHPFYFDCPLRFLDKANYQPCEVWRSKVRKWHQKHDARSTPHTMPVTA